MSRSTGLAVSHRNQHCWCTCSQYAFQQVAAAASGAARSSMVYTQCQHKPADDAPAAPAEDTLCRIRAILRACTSSACLIYSLRSAVWAPHTAFSCTPACLSTASAVHRADSVELYRPGQKPGLTPFSSPARQQHPQPLLPAQRQPLSSERGACTGIPSCMQGCMLNRTQLS